MLLQRIPCGLQWRQSRSWIRITHIRCVQPGPFSPDQPFLLQIARCALRLGLTFCAPDQVYVAKPNARKKLVRGKPLGRYYEMLVTQEQELSGAAKRKGHEGNGGEKIDLENFEKDGQERRRINSPTSVGLFCFCDGLSVSLSFSLSPLSFLPTSQVRRCDCPRVSFVGTVGSELNRQIQVS